MFGVASLLFSLQALLLSAGECRLQGIGRSGFVAAFAFLVEVHGRPMQTDQRTRRLDGIRRVAEIVLCQHIEVELFRRRGFPQKVHVDVGSDLFSLCQEFGQAGLGKT